MNAAVWFGAVIFFTCAVGPAFFSSEMLGLLGRPHSGAAAQLVIERYFITQQWCAGIAIAHLIAEWLYARKPFQKWMLILLMVLFTISILGAKVIQPRMKELHRQMYAVQSTQEQRDAARKPFDMLHGTSSATNLLVICGVLVYLWQVTTAPSARFASLNKFRAG
ncbi:MAG: DUF4149 domain-containing protein [Verrucomicrobiales bacterium]